MRRFFLVLSISLLFSPAAMMASDADGDGLADGVDNCVDVQNASQCDANLDGFGNTCDGDFNDDGVVDFVDTDLFNDAFTSQDPVADMNCDGVVDFVDQPIFQDQLEQGTPGPSGLACAGVFPCADTDLDGLTDLQDNCIEVPNAIQCDTDQDLFGNTCDGDFNDDGVVDFVDTDLFNDALTSQDPVADMNCDGVVDFVDQPIFQDQLEQGTPGPSGLLDSDGDGLHDYWDNCPNTTNPGQDDLDGDGVGDVCDADIDGDGYANDDDNCILVANASQVDTNGDGYGNACDGDLDQDGVVGTLDEALFDATFGLDPEDPGYDPAANCEDPAEIGPEDADCFDAQLLLGVPGPSGLVKSFPAGLGGSFDGDGWLDDFDNCVSVANPDQADADADSLGDPCEMPAEPPGFDPTTFTVVFLPDTQNYREANPVPRLHTEWICQNRWALNIVLVTQLGDVSGSPDDTDQYEKMSKAMGVLDACGGVPWSVVPGNHDRPSGTGTIDYTYYLQYFPPSRWEGFPWFGGASPEDQSHCASNNYCKDVNTYQVIDTKVAYSGAEISLLHVGIEFDYWQAGARNWANEIIGQHSDLPAMLSTHSHAGPGGSGGECTHLSTAFTDEVVEANASVFFVSSGHAITAIGECESRRPNPTGGLGLVELYANYQKVNSPPSPPLAEEGWLRYCTFDPVSDTASCQTYSPLLEQYRWQDPSTITDIGLAERLSPP